MEGLAYCFYFIFIFWHSAIFLYAIHQHRNYFFLYLHLLKPSTGTYSPAHPGETVNKRRHGRGWALGQRGKEPKEHLGIPSSVFRLSIFRGSQRDVVYIGWPIAPSSMWGGKVAVRGLSCEYSCAHEAQSNFGDLTPYLTYELWSICKGVRLQRLTV